MRIPDWQLQRIETPLVRVLLRRGGYAVLDDILCRSCLEAWQRQQPPLGRHERVDVSPVLSTIQCEWCTQESEARLA